MGQRRFQMRKMAPFGAIRSQPGGARRMVGGSASMTQRASVIYLTDARPGLSHRRRRSGPSGSRRLGTMTERRGRGAGADRATIGPHEATMGPLQNQKRPLRARMDTLGKGATGGGSDGGRQAPRRRPWGRLGGGLPLYPPPPAQLSCLSPPTKPRRFPWSKLAKPLPISLSRAKTATTSPSASSRATSGLSSIPSLQPSQAAERLRRRPSTVR